MSYRVETFDSLMPDATNSLYNALDLEKALNKAEEDGWSLVKILDQHRQWADDDESGMGGLVGPYVVLHKPNNS